MSLALLALVAGERPASACSLAAHDEHQLNPDGGDVTGPDAPVVNELDVRRGNACEEGDTCQDLGFITMRLAPGVDDQTAAEEMGYRVTLSAGSLDDTSLIPEYDLRLFGDEIFLVWADGASNDQEAIDLTLELIAIDQSGNQSQPTYVDVTHPGGTGTCGVDPVDPDDPNDPDSAGCAISVRSGQSGWGALGLVMLGLLLLRRRNRH